MARVRHHQGQLELHGQEVPPREPQAVHQPARELMGVHRLRQTAVIFCTVETDAPCGLQEWFKFP